MIHTPPPAGAGAAPIKRDDPNTVVTHTDAKGDDITIAGGAAARRYGLDPEAVRRWGLDPESDFQVRAAGAAGAGEGRSRATAGAAVKLR
jgi:hypothetical protein